MMKLELKNLTKSYEKGKIALDHFSKWGWKIDLNEPDYAKFRAG